MRKPYPMKIVDEDDERVSIADDLVIEFAGKPMTQDRARKLSEWLWAAADWIDTEIEIREAGGRSRGRPRKKVELKPWVGHVNQVRADKDT